MFVRAYNLIILLNNKNQFTIPISQLFGSLVGHFSTYHKTDQSPPLQQQQRTKSKAFIISFNRLKLIELKTKTQKCMA